MMTPKSLAELVSRSAAPNAVVERDSDLILRSALGTDDLRQAWRALRSAPPAYLAAVFITDADSDAPLDEVSPPGPDEMFRITLRKQVVAGELRLLSAGALVNCAEAFSTCNCLQIADMAPEQTFATYRARVQPWTLEAAAPFAPSEPLPDPRTFTKDFTGVAIVPADIRPWLLRSAPTAPGPAYTAWRQGAERRLVAALADQVTLEAGGVCYHFNGPPSQSFALSDAELTALAPGLFAGAGWVYGEAHDVEIRRLLLANEWARSYRPAPTGDVALQSLASAKSAYSAYVKSSSRETLKALADLRKAVIEETQKVSQRAQDLASALWKDLAVASAPFVLKILSDSAKIPTGNAAGGLALVAAAFLVFSFGMQVYINSRFFKRQQDSRGVWRQALNMVLSPKDLDDFSEKPIRDSLKDYVGVRNAVGVFYGALIAILIVFGVYDLLNGSGTAYGKPAPPASASPAPPPKLIPANNSHAVVAPSKPAGAAPPAQG